MATCYERAGENAHVCFKENNVGFRREGFHGINEKKMHNTQMGEFKKKVLFKMANIQIVTLTFSIWEFYYI